jgi:Arc/MetJ-type ribon-helix-helix transcriptional regulator
MDIASKVRQKDQSAHVNFRLTVQSLRQLDQQVKKLRTSRSEVIRAIVESWIEQEEKRK